MPQSQEVLTETLTLVESDLQQRRFSSAMGKLTRISNTCSHDLHFLGLLAQTQQGLSDFSGLIRTLSVTAKIRQTAPAFLDLMYALYTQGRLHEALDIGLLLQDMELTEVQARALAQGLVRIYLEFSDYEGVLEIIDAGQGADDDSLMTWARGLVELEAGRRDEALALFRRAVEQQSTNDRAWISLAMLHEEMGDRELALANLERALDLNPENATGLKLMAQWHSRAGGAPTPQMHGKISYYLAQYEFVELKKNLEDKMKI